MAESNQPSTAGSTAQTPESQARTNRSRRMTPLRFILLTVAIVLVAYVAYQRIGTTANADTITYIRNYGGGFVAVGMTDRQPGFIVVSALDRSKVDYEADMVRSTVAGTHTNVRVQTPQSQWQIRLRAPRVIVIKASGEIASVPVKWTRDDFIKVIDNLDCSKVHPKGGPHQCGHPFEDLDHVLNGWDQSVVPSEISAFLASYVKVTSNHATDR